MNSGKGINIQLCGFAILHLTMALDGVCDLGNMGTVARQPGELKNFNFCQLLTLGKQDLFFPTESPSEEHIFSVCRGKKEYLFLSLTSVEKC